MGPNSTKAAEKGTPARVSRLRRHAALRNEPPVSPSAGTYPWLDADRKLTGTARLLLGFVIGALFALLPMYYFSMGRDAALRGPNVARDQSLASADPSRVAETTGGRSGSKPFASRMTYELSQLPEDRPAAPPKAAPPVTVASAPLVRPVAAPVSAPAAPAGVELPATDRVVNARPISVVPPEPRDRTREIEKEAQKTEYREPARRQPQAAPSPVVGRVIEGRAVELEPPPKVVPETPARSIVAGVSADKKAAEAPKKAIEDRSPVAVGPPVPGVTPIKPPARDGGSAQTVIAKAPAATSAIAASGAEAPASSSAARARDAVESRLATTRDWLAAAAPTTHTIQLMGTNSEEQLRTHLQSLAKVVEPGKLYVFRTKAQGKPSITVVYGAYADRKSALQALEKLPAAIAANKPVLRTVNGIRAEMKQHNTDS